MVQLSSYKQGRSRAGQIRQQWLRTVLLASGIILLAFMVISGPVTATADLAGPALNVTSLTVNFTASETTGIASAGKPFTVTFTSSEPPDGASYLWDFGDGTTSTEANPTHEYYGRLKSFTVNLTVYNGADRASAIKSDYIHTRPYVKPFPKYDSTGSFTGYYSQIPADLDGDNIFEDINHNGRVDYDDVVAIYDSITNNWFTTNTDVDQVNFDYSGNGSLGFQDVIVLNDHVL